MSALNVGKVAPDFTLPLVAGGTFSLKKALENGPVVLFFFKISCPVCQYAAPFVQRLHEISRGTGVSVVGASQNDAQETEQFIQQFGMTFPVALDDQQKFPVSNSYGLTNVPTLFYIRQDGKISHSVVGWSRSDMEAIAHETTGNLNAAPATLFKPGEDVAEFRAG